MHLTHQSLQGHRRRRSYSAEYKAQIVEQCLQPHVSIASIVLANGLNAILLRRWLDQYKAAQQPAAAIGRLCSAAKACLYRVAPSIESG